MYDWFSNILALPTDYNAIVCFGAVVCFVLTLACVLKLLLKVFGV